MVIKSTMAGSRKIEDLCEKCLVAAVEALDSPRQDVILKPVCDSNTTMFGVPGSNLRRDVQEHWNNLRRCTIRSYKMVLDKHNIPPSQTTDRLLQEQTRIPSPESSKLPSGRGGSTTSTDASRSTMTYGDHSSKESASQHEQDDDDDMIGLVHAFKDQMQIMGGKMTSTDTSTQSSGVTTMMTPGRNMFSSPAVSAHMRFTSPQDQTSSIMSFSCGDNNEVWQGKSIEVSTPSSTLPLDYRGSVSNPFPVDVDFDFPERSFPFEVIRVPRIEHNGWAREGIHIRVIIGIGDGMAWSAQMDESLPGRAIMIIGRSRSSAFDALDSYHRNDDKSSDVLAVHTTVKQEIERDPSRQALYWRLVMPEGYFLDNATFSSDSKAIKKKENGITYSVAGKAMQCKCLFAVWEVARANTGHALTIDTGKALFDAFA